MLLTDARGLPLCYTIVTANEKEYEPLADLHDERGDHSLGVYCLHPGKEFIITGNTSPGTSPSSRTSSRSGERVAS